MIYCSRCANGVVLCLLAFLTVPLFSLMMSLRNQAPWWRKELVSAQLLSVIAEKMNLTLARTRLSR